MGGDERVRGRVVIGIVGKAEECSGVSLLDGQA